MTTSASPRKRSAPKERTKRQPKRQTGEEPKTGTEERSATPPAEPAGTPSAHPTGGTDAATPSRNGDRSAGGFRVPSLDEVAAGAANAAMLPVAVARQVLPAKGGLPVYLGLGVLGAVDVLEWPVAIGFGVGYAMLRRRGGPSARPAA
ncbi:hypothetical protein ACLGI4_03860 [Streptomyces sp. HMX112]|uniref:hypothetical protein n=1 Tax=Streptomyces sp. HMX112 TaxID=3390850 RepID=UPI003A7FACC0